MEMETIVKIKLPHWTTDKCYYVAKKITYLNHRLIEKIKYKVVERVQERDFNTTLISKGMAGFIYHQNEVIEIK